MGNNEKGGRGLLVAAYRKVRGFINRPWFYNKKFLITLSAICSVLMWATLAINISPVETKTVSSVPITINVDTIKENFGLDFVDIIRLIRNAGGNPLSRDKQGNTPFSIVVKKDISVIREVLGNAYTITDSDGNTPIHIVVKANASDELLQTLISEGYPVDTRNADGYTALNYAIENDDVKTALVLLENGANPFQQIDKKGKNGISIALEKNNKKMISNIVKYAGKMTDVQGNTILHYAAKTCTPEMVKTLISYGIDKSVKNVSGDTAYTIAVRWKKPDVAALLK